MKSALVTGGSGFVGRAVVRRLEGDGVAVTHLARPASSVVGDVVRVVAWDEPTLGRALAGRRFDAVFHLAAAGVDPGAREPGALFAANVAAPAALVTACDAGVFVHAGTCSEYAAPVESVRVGEDHPIGAVEPYGASKAAGALWAASRAAARGLPFTWLRVFGVYGPGEAPHRLVPALAHRLERGERVPLTDGRQRRDFLHVDDAARGFVVAGRAGVAGVFNLCSGAAVSVRAVAEMVARLMGQPADLLDFGATPMRAGELPWLVGDPGRLCAATGFSPAIALEDGLASTLAARRAE